MKKKAGNNNRNNDAALDREDNARRALEQGEDPSQHEDVEKFDPRRGEDPGALELTEDPLERRQKRVTM